VTALAAAALLEIAATADYQIAQVDIAFATGMLLGAANVEWAPAATPSVSRRDMDAPNRAGGAGAQ
jgi:hypothetical protein